MNFLTLWPTNVEDKYFLLRIQYTTLSVQNYGSSNSVIVTECQSNLDKKRSWAQQQRVTPFEPLFKASSRSLVLKCSYKSVPLGNPVKACLPKKTSDIKN
ncbi:hypothetical protein OUZ56_015932 [Daphnia magna]|uniref:Uncharacterized protein n=1 Tax=Daphnia magna TaxID=35525 RepID=A0ABR0AP62_9CRUS|nr:hypothetical protein OUZ56_015932 [Daphnia magna]